jgi:hypothetical protein
VRLDHLLSKDSFLDAYLLAWLVVRWGRLGVPEHAHGSITGYSIRLWWLDRVLSWVPVGWVSQVVEWSGWRGRVARTVGFSGSVVGCLPRRFRVLVWSLRIAE